jgi:signal transduction histidine kinase
VIAATAPHAVTVLVVDEDPSILGLARANVPVGWRVLEAHTGAEVLALSAAEQVDLVVLGLPLPDVDGLEICRELERRGEHEPFLPVLVLTAPDDRGPREAALAAGADDVISKPVDASELQLRLRVLGRLREHELLARSRGCDACAQQDELSALVAHDLRNPLSAAAGILGVLAKEVTEPGLREDLETAYSGVARAREILDDVLRARMIEAGTIVASRSTSDLAEIARVAGKSLAVAAADQGVALVTPQGPGPQLAVDPNLVRRAVENLVANAVRYSRRGSTVEISARPEGAGAVIEVADRGPRIPDGLKKTVFEKLGSVAAERAEARRGHGLSLHLVGLVATLHGGRVEALDRDGGGTVFRLFLAPGG